MFFVEKIHLIPPACKLSHSLDILGTALRAAGRILAQNHHLAAVLAVPDRDAMAPPQLTADAPVADVLHPVHVLLGEALGHKLGLAAGHGLDGRLGQRLNVN